MSKLTKRQKLAWTVPLPDGLLESILKAHADMSPEGRSSFGARTIVIAKAVHGLGLKTPQSGNIVASCSFRLIALARLTADEEIRGWTKADGVDGVDGVDGCDMVHPAVIKATATEPLFQQGDEFGFDKVSFRSRVLKIADSEGFA